MTTPTEDKVNAYKKATAISSSDLIKEYHYPLYSEALKTEKEKHKVLLFLFCLKDSQYSLLPIFPLFFMFVFLLLLGLVFPELLGLVFPEYEKEGLYLFIALIVWYGISLIIPIENDESACKKVANDLDQMPHWTIDTTELNTEERLFLEKLLVESKKVVPFNWETLLRIRYYAELIGVAKTSKNPANQSSISQLRQGEKETSV